MGMCVRVFISSSLLLFLIAPAWSLTIDEFNGDGQVQALAGELNDLLVLTPSAAGGNRCLKVQGTGGGGQVTLKTFGGYLSHSQDSATTGQSWIIWDGDLTTGNLNAQGLGGIDLTQDGGSALRITGVYFDYPFGNPLDLVLVVYDASDPLGLKWSSTTVTLSQALQDQTITMPFANFLSYGPGGPASFQNVGAILLWIKGEYSDVDIQMASIGTDGICLQVPDQFGRVMDDCGVCGGDNSDKDLCGVCFGDNSTCLDCNGVPNGGAELDLCGVCGGNGTSCLDCHGVPFGGARLDQCGVCGGNGSTCMQCSETDISDMLKELITKAGAQRRLSRRLLKKLCPAKETSRKKLQRKVETYYSQMMNLVKSLPTTMLRCINSEECIEIEDYTPAIEQYNAFSKKLHAVSRKIIAAQRWCVNNMGGVCKGSPAECAERARQRGQEQRKAGSQSQRLMKENTTYSKKVPCVTNVCR